MSTVAVFDLVAFFSSLAALAFVLAARRGAFRRDAVVLFGMLVVVVLFRDTSNAAESLRFTDRLDVVEDRIELLIPMLWGFFLYAFLQGRTYHELRETRERDRLLLASLPQHIFFKTGRELKFAAVNESFARHVGMTPEELVGKTDRDLFPADMAARFQAEDREVMESGQPRVEVKKYPYDGLERTYELLKAPVRDDSGEVAGILGVFTDVTERSRAREALRQSEERFRRLVDTAFDGISITAFDADTDVRTLLFCNDRFVEMSGYTREELRDCPNLNELVDLHVTKGELDRNRERIQRGEPFRTTLAWRRPDGRDNIIECSCFALQVDGDYHLMSVDRDVTDRVRAAQALEAAEREKSTILSSLAEHVIYQDPEHQVLWANKAAGDAVGRSPHELVGARCFHTWAGGDAECEGCPVALAMEVGQVREAEITTPDGRVWLVRGSPVFGAHGEVVGAVETTLDVSERRKAVEALRASEERYRLISENATDMISIHRIEDLSLLYANPSALAMLGQSRAEAAGLDALDYVHPDDRRLVEARFREGVARGEGTAEFRVKDRDGRYVWLEATGKITPGQDGRSVALIISRDITERVQQTEELRALAVEDSLTQLNNRKGFMHLAEQQIRFAHRTQKVLLLFRIDVDNMRWINDSLGHKDGDLALIETANVLREVFRESDIIGRIGGDEFAVLAIEAPENGASVIMERLRSRVDARNTLPGRRYTLSCSVGIAGYDPEAPLPLDELVAQADVLMYENKRRKPRPD